ncbi:MAG TPA: ribosomal-processing cysteine protease Prp [Lachnospiraceae bacterium]|nr:ribosomal-processing cysteine protease Prp [Lachnospiraceae bacterium]
MITAKVLKKQDGSYDSFSCSGHAGFSVKGKDIVCAAVSILVINTANAMEQFTDAKFECSSESTIEWKFLSAPDAGAKLLMDSMLLGLKEIQNEYGKRYLRLIFEEV